MWQMSKKQEKNTDHWHNQKEHDIASEKLHMICDYLADIVYYNKISNDTIKECIRKYHWISGSSTEVMPVAYWDQNPEVVIQLRGNSKQSHTIIRELKKQFKDSNYCYWYTRNDGSCPNELTIQYDITIDE